MIEWWIELVASGFWQAIGALFLAGAVIGLAISVLNAVIFKNQTFQTILIQLAGIPLWFAVWQIRGGTGWLVFGIISSILGLLTIISAIKKK